jgi:hypothetical protein
MKRLTLAVSILVFLAQSAIAADPQAVADQHSTIQFPKIDRRPPLWEPATPETMTSLPRYDPQSAQRQSKVQKILSLLSTLVGTAGAKHTDPYDIDLRGKDLSGLDLKDSLNDLLQATFDSGTVWPPQDRMPREYDRQKILELGKNPGLGVRALHDRGVTGRAVGLAIIDFPLLIEHEEYKDRLRLYEEINVEPSEKAEMHGAAVASIAVGKTIGVAPEAELYYIGSWPGDWNSGAFTYNFRYYAEAVLRIMAVNKLLPPDRRIRVISMSIGWDKDQAGYDEITAACDEAKAAGLFLVSSSLDEVHGFRFHGLGRSPLADPDKFESYEPGLWWADGFSQNSLPADMLLFPMDSRTLADYTRPGDYYFCRSGGWSWSIPYIAGLYALTCQVEPTMTPERFWQLARKTGRTIQLKRGEKPVSFGPIVDPAALIEAAERLPKTQSGS